jgi:fermentation-respiration switch protein FrsA (DUF1100 family)
MSRTHPAAGYHGAEARTVLFEERLIFFPSRDPAGFREAEAWLRGQPEALRLEDCAFAASDGVRLHAWWCGPRAADPQAVLLFFHGNAGHLAHRCDLLRRLVALPAQVLIVDYRGYGRSEGTPSEEGLYRDARAAWDHLTGPRGIGPGRIVVFGKSLGGAPAVDLAAQVQPAGLVVQSSFTSIPDMVAHVMPLVPRRLIRTRMDSRAKIQQVRCPKLFIHSPADEVVPFELGRRLFEAAPEPKRFHEVPGAAHNETYRVGGEAYLGVLREFVRSCVGAQP